MAAMLAAAAVPLPARAAPERVVSLHLCADQLVLKLADRGQIASVSRLAADPALSYMAGAVGDIPLNDGFAEEAVALAPDLVLAGPFSNRQAAAVLERLGVRVERLDLPADFAAIAEQTIGVAALLGHPERGRRLAAEMQARLADLAPARAAPRAAAALLQPNGMTLGRGTLEDAVIRAAGYANLADRLGVRGLGHLPLEALVLDPPALLVVGARTTGEPSLAGAVFDHAAFRHVRERTELATMPDRLWSCGAWFTAEAVAILAHEGAP